MRKYPLSLLQKALLAVTVVLLPVILTFVYSYNRSEKHLKEHVLNDLTFIAEAYEGQVYQFIEMTKRRMEDFSSDGFIIERFQQVVEGQKSEVKPLNDYISRYKLPLNTATNAINLISLDGLVVASTDNSAIGKHSPRVAPVQKGQGSIYGATVISGTTAVSISVPLFSRKNDRHIGFIEGRIDLSGLNHVLSGHLSKQLGALSWSKGKKRTLEIYLVNKDNRMITESMFVKDAILKQKVDTVPIRECLKSNNEFTGFYNNYRGVEVAGASMCMPAMEWVLLAEVEADDALASLEEMRRDAFVGAGVVVSLIMLLLAAFYRDVVQRLRMITDAAGSLSKGDYSVNMPVLSQDEVGRLTGTFNVMTSNIKERSKEIIENQEKLSRLNRLYSVLSRINEAIVRIRDRERLFEEACRIVVEDGGFQMSWIGTVDPSTLLVKPVAHCCGDYEGSYIDGLVVSVKDIPEGRGPIGTVIREGRHIICNDIEHDPSMAPWRDKALRYGYRSSAAFPLRLGTSVIGPLTIYSGDPNFFNNEEIELLDTMAADISFAMESIETERQAKQTDEELHLLQTISISVAEADSFHSALKVVIENICRATGWELGEVWVPNPNGTALEYCPECCSVGKGVERFVEYSKDIKFPAGTGLPGRVWASKRPEWITDISASGNIFPRKAVALEVGLRAGFGVPIVVNDRVHAVIEFFMSEPGEEDKRYVELVSAISAQLSSVMQRKLAEEERLRLQHRYEGLVNNLPVGIYRNTPGEKGRFIEANPALVAMVEAGSKEELLSHNVSDFYEDKNRRKEISDKILKHGFIEDEEIEIVTLKGNRIWVSITSVAKRDDEGNIFFDGVIENITERKKLEHQLLHSQKMEAVGQLAGGIAHDFNNALTAIIGFGKLLLMKRGSDELVKNFTQHIIDAGESAANLVQGILAFSRKQTIIPQPMDISELVMNVEKILRRLIGEDIELRTLLPDSPVIVKADPTQIEQILMNLATNARDAMPGGGAITIGIDSLNLDDEFVKAHGYGEPGPYAMLSFADRGMGMDEETRKRIFEPFFTTKEVGKGTGLGLATAYGIIKQHEGYINVYSEPGRGTTFRIYLPLMEAVTGAGELQERVAPKGGNETILLAEDDERVRRITLSVLEDFGYNVIVAVNGEDAVGKFLENKDKIDLCICDMVMPKKGGREAYEEMRKIRPDIRVIFMSGYAADKTKGIIEEGLDFISKPVSPSEFLRKIREVLDR